MELWNWTKTIWLYISISILFRSDCCSPYVCIYHQQGCPNNPIPWNLGLCAACWACSTCLHELWPTLVSHPFSSLNSSLGLAGGKHYQKVSISILGLVLQNFALPGCFSIFFSIAIFSPYFLLVDLLLQMKDYHSEWKINLMGAHTFCISFFYIFFQLIVIWRVWVICVREYNYGNSKIIFVFNKLIFWNLTGLGLRWWWSDCNHRLSGPRLNIKTVLFTYGDFHVKDKTDVRTSYL